jgi:signal transduction histidine kinase
VSERNDEAGRPGPGREPPAKALGRRRRRARLHGGARPGRSLAHRVTAVVVVGLLTVLVLGWVLRTHERVVAATAAFAEGVIERTAIFERLWSTLPRDERRRLFRNWDGPLFRITIEDAAPPAPARRHEVWHADAVRRAVAGELEALGPEARLYVLRPQRITRSPEAPPWRRDAPQPPEGTAPRPPDRDPERHGSGDRDRRHDDGARPERPFPDHLPHVLLVVPRDDGGSWLVVRAAAPELEWQLRRTALSWGTLLLLLVAGLVFLALRRATRPLRELTAAAERLGRDMDAPPLPVRGPREVRAAARAFNEMQARIRRLLADRTEMLAGVSHDLRTMLTRFRLRIEDLPDPAQRERAEQDLREMTAMLTEALAWAREESDPEPRERMDLAVLLLSLVDEETDLGHEATFGGPERCIVEVHPVALRRALGNLIQNAVRYGARADVGLEVREDGVEVTVEDRGPGIPEDEREDVFRPFHRLEGSRNRATGGTGLGLSVARTVVHRHGGTIDLGDRPGGGLRVTVRLPVRPLPYPAR